MRIQRQGRRGYGLMSGTFLDTSQHAEHFPDLLTVQEFTPGTTNNHGVVEPGTWENVAELTDLTCLKFNSKGEEIPAADGAQDEMEVSTHTILTQDFYPAITHAHRGVIDGQVYKFLICDHEGMKTVGVIKAKRVKG